MSTEQKKPNQYQNEALYYFLKNVWISVCSVKNYALNYIAKTKHLRP